MSVLSVGVSFFVGVVALITAYITYLNLRVITEVSLYLFAKTEGGILEQNNYSQYPDRINVTYRNNGLTIPPTHPTPIRWFDLDLGNTGPGIAIIETWSVDYDSKARDFKEMNSNNKIVLGPQSRLTIVGYIPRDYSPSTVGSQNIFYPVMTNLPNSLGTFPWKIEITYRKKLIKPTSHRYKMEFEISSSGSVKSMGPTVVDN